ncbi:hypothetical protein ATZ36_08330 [Candidatus Endomicrobiellum trichonymphae]|jgi:GTP-binding protein EngB required for normal cell division|uniref:Uncharacterized protein n=1 Tax=Endomicrobium trichonymphae TaxID=1408204 RepID=A0A1E5IGN0_ENDTX|nr:hypothetical protein ATZ36_08330 [Candidatus Endomicrobium trichonymphae]
MLRGIVPDCLIKKYWIIGSVGDGVKVLTIQIEIFGRINVGKSSLMKILLQTKIRLLFHKQLGLRRM